MTDKQTVSLTYIGTSWTTGMDYEQNCQMCQGRGAGVSNMIPLPTIKVQLQHGTDSNEVFLCKGCIDRGLKAGHLEAANAEPAGCPFAM